jgi:carbon storage regulator CsrA
MLILGRKLNERIRLTVNGVTIWVEVNRIAANDVRIGITAPKEVAIEREEIIGHDAPQ